LSECGAAVEGEVMRDHYRQFFHPVLDFAPDMAKSLFAEFDKVADELRAHSLFVGKTCKSRSRLRGLDLTQQDWLWLFNVWRDHDGGQQEFLDAERAALLDSLNDERELLFKTRERFPEHRVELTARLYQIGLVLAELQIRT
jgi:hypothetical protein